MMNAPLPPAPLPQSQTIYSYRQWCAKFLARESLSNEHAFAWWMHYQLCWIGGNN